MRHIIFLLTISLFVMSCGQNDTKQKELELKERELALKEKELALKEKDTVGQKTPTNAIDTKTTLPTENPTLDGYNFDKHNDIKIFINDLAKAVNVNDKNAITQMINFPFVDTWGDNPGNHSTPLGCKTSNEFSEKYDKIFTKGITNAIQNKKYRGYDYDDVNGEDVINKGEYLIFGDGKIDGDTKRPHNMLAIKKVNGKFKIYALKFFS